MNHWRLVLTPAALRQYKRFPARVRTLLKQAMKERLIVQNPTIEDRNRFRLRRASLYADYELRVQEWRVFYRMEGEMIIVELIGKKVGNCLVIEGKEFVL